MPTKYNQNWDCTIQIGQYFCSAFRWQTHVGTYGQLGRSMISTSMTALREGGINLDTLNASSQGANIPTSQSPSSVNIPVLVSVNGKTIFGGYYMHGHFMAGRSEAEIWIRDYSCVLFDSKQSLADLNYQNSTVNELVKAICDFKGLASRVTSTVGAKTMVGTVFDQTGLSQGGVSMNTYPQSYWNIITLLARQCNAQVYTVPSNDSGLGQVSAGTLVFEDIPKSSKVWPYTWLSKPVLIGPNSRPIMDIDILHQPQRNKSFAVVVKSHHAQSTLTRVQTVTVAGEDVQTINNRTIPAGFYSGSGGAAAQIRGLLSNKALGLPVYEFRVDGLTATQAQQKAESIAQEIAAKLFVVDVLMDFNPDIKPLDHLLVTEYEKGSLLHFTNKTLYINGVSHTFNMGQGEGIGTDGLQTQLKCLSLPPVVNPLSPEDLSSLLGGI